MKVKVLWFILLPVIVSVVFALLYAGVLANSNDFSRYNSLKVDNPDLVNPLSKILLYSFIVLGVGAFLSVGLWIYLNYSKPSKVGRVFHDKSFCDGFIKEDFFRRFKYKLLDFTEVGTSIDSAQNFSAVPRDPEYVYISTYRVKEQGGRDRYVLALMNMEDGKELLLHYDHNITNDKASILSTIKREAPMLVENREKVKVVVQDDFTTGRRQQTNIPVQDLEGDEPVKGGVKGG